MDVPRLLHDQISEMGQEKTKDVLFLAVFQYSISAGGIDASDNDCFEALQLGQKLRKAPVKGQFPFNPKKLIIWLISGLINIKTIVTQKRGSIDRYPYRSFAPKREFLIRKCIEK